MSKAFTMQVADLVALGPSSNLVAKMWMRLNGVARTEDEEKIVIIKNLKIAKPN